MGAGASMAEVAFAVAPPGNARGCESSEKYLHFQFDIARAAS
jgi:hypothetical protein